jgi:hypothetical protein
MYLTQNLRIQSVLDFNVQNLGADDTRWVGNIEYKTSEQVMAEYRWAVDCFLDMLLAATANVAPDRIILSFDGYRPQMYGPIEEIDFARKSVWGVMRTYFIGEARKRGIVTIDLDGAFREQYALDRRRFESATDNHWNGHGHEVLAHAVEQTLSFRQTFWLPEK